MLSSTLIVFLTLLVSVDVAVILAILLVLFLRKRNNIDPNTQVDQLEKKLSNIQKSTRVTVPAFQPWHERLRMRFKWYYNWHLKSYSRGTHWGILFGYLLVISLYFGIKYAIIISSFVSTIVLIDLLYKIFWPKRAYEEALILKKAKAVSQRDIEKKIEQIQESTKTTFAPMVPWHERLRERFRWYYNWHLNPFSTRIHLASFAIYVVAISFGVIYGIWQHPSYPAHAVCTEFDWTGVGDGVSWDDMDNWSCMAGYPSTSDHSVRINTGSLNITTPSGSALTIASLEIGSDYSGTFSLGNSLTVNGAFSLAGGTFSQGANNDLMVKGDFTIANASTFTKGTGTSKLIIDGTPTANTLTDSSTVKKDLGALQIGASPGTTNLGSDITASSLTVPTSDIFNTMGYDLTIGGAVSVTGTLDTTDAGTSGYEGDGTILSTAGDFTMNTGGVFTKCVQASRRSLIKFNKGGGGTQNLTSKTQDMGDIQVSTASSTTLLNLLDALTAQNITIDASTTLDPRPSSTDYNITAANITVNGTLDGTSSSAVISSSGNWTVTGTFNSGSTTVTFTSTSTGKTITPGGQSFNNLTFNGSGGGWMFMTDTTIAGDITMTAGTLDSMADVTVSGGDVTGDGTISLSSGRFTLTGTGNFGGATNWSFFDLFFGNGTDTHTSSKTGNNQITVLNELKVATSHTLSASSSTWNLSWGAGVLNKVTAIGSGNYAMHAIAIRSDDSVWDWGHNRTGQLGNNTNFDFSYPVQVLGSGGTGTLSGLSKTTAGLYHSVGLKTDNTVVSWGYNGHGELGNASTTDVYYPVGVKDVGGSGTLSNITEISAGIYHTMALKNDGTIYGWGYNTPGQIGDGTTAQKTSPVQTLGVGGSGYLTDVVSVSAGGYHSCAVKSDGTVYCWGRNNEKQLGDTTTNNSTTPVQVVGVGGTGTLSGVSKVICGYAHSLAIKTDGTMVAWGMNTYGQLGDGANTNMGSPVVVKDVGGSGSLSNVSQVAAGLCHTIALKTDGTVYAWGYNNVGQLGINNQTNKNTPNQVLDEAGTGYLSGITQVAAAQYNSYCLKSDGRVNTFGYSTYGTNGNRSSDIKKLPAFVGSPSVNFGGSALSDVSMVVAGYHNTVALKTDGSVWTWGRGIDGQSGNNINSPSSTPVMVSDVGGSNYLTGVKSIASGLGFHVLALKTDGTVYAWGNNTYGAIGDNTTTTRSAPVQVKGVGGSGYLTDVASIGAGNYSSVAVKTDGTIYTWGLNDQGQLGNNTKTSSNTPVQVLGVGGSGYLTDVKEAYIGQKHTVAVKTDGTVYAWGYNGSYQLGDNTNTQSSVPVQVKDAPGTGYLTGITSVRAGYSHCVALKSDGTVWAWGFGTSGQLGNGASSTSGLPVQVKGVGNSGYLTDAIAIGAGGIHSIALRSNGTVVAWGRNLEGQLGDTTLTNRNYPVQSKDTDGTSDLSNIDSIPSTGYFFSVAKKNDGTVYSWGQNAYGLFSNYSNTNSAYAVQAKILTRKPITVSGTLQADTSTFNYSSDFTTGLTGTANKYYTEISTLNYYNLTLNSGTETFVLPSGTTVNNNVTITAGTLDATINNYALSCGGNWTNAGNFVSRSGTVTMNAGATGKTIYSNGKSFYNLTFNNASGAWEFSDPATITGNFTIISSSGTVGVDTNDQAINIDGNFLMSAGKLTMGSSAISVDGNWTNTSGTTVPETSTVTLSGADSSTQTIAGNSTFNNLSISTSANTAGRTISFTAGSTQTISSWTIAGASGKVLTLNSTTPGSAWYFVIPEDMTSGTYLSVQDSQNTTNAYRITPGANTTSLGNNIPGWLFNSTVAGSLYDAIGGSKITASKTIKASINGGTPTSNTSSNGDFSVDLGAILSANDIVTVFVDGDAVLASTITKVSAYMDLTGINLFQAYATIRHEGSIASIANSDLAVADDVSDTDILFSADGSNNATFTQGVYILASKTYAPGANVALPGSWYNAGTFTPGTSSVTFTSTAIGKTINSGTGGFYDIVFNNAGGAWQFNDTTSVARNFTITTSKTSDNGVNFNNQAINIDGDFQMDAGLLTMGSAAVTAGGSWTINGGTQTANTSGVTFDATATGKTIKSSSQSFNNITFNGSGGGWTLQDNTTATSITVTLGTLVDNAKTVTVNGNIIIANTSGILTSTGTWVVNATANVANPYFSNNRFEVLQIKTGITATATEHICAKKIVLEASAILTGAKTLYIVYPTADDAIDLASGANISMTSVGYYQTGSTTRNQKAMSFSASFFAAYGVSTTLAMTGDWSVGAVTVYGTYTSVSEATSSVLDTNGYNLVSSGALTLGSSQVAHPDSLFGKILFKTGTHSFAGNVICSGQYTHCYMDFASANVYVGGNLNVSYTDVTAGTSTVHMNATATGKTVTSASQSFNNLTFNGSGGGWTLQDGTTLTGDLTITAGTVTAGATTITVGGNWNSATGTFTYGTSTVVMGSASGDRTITTSGSGTYTDIKFYKLTINSSSNKVSWSTGVGLGISNLLTITGNLEIGSGKNIFLAAGADMTINTSSQLSGSGTMTRRIDDAVDFTNSGSINIAEFIYEVDGAVGTGQVTPTTYNGNLTIKNYGPSTVTANLLNGTALIVTGNITITNDTVGYTTTLDNAVDYNPITIGGNWDNNTRGIYSGYGETVTFNSSSNSATINAPNSTFGQVVFNNATGEWTISSALSCMLGITITNSGTAGNGVNFNNQTIGIGGNFQMDAGLLTMGSAAVTAGGSWTINGGTQTANTSGVTFDATATGKTIKSSSQSFNNLTFNGSGGGWTFSDNSSMTGNFTLTTGTVAAGATTIAVAGNWSATSGTFTKGTSIVQLTGTGSVNNTYGNRFYDIVVAYSDKTTSGTVYIDRKMTVNSGTLSASVTIGWANDVDPLTIVANSTISGLIELHSATATTLTVNVPAYTYGGGLILYNNNSSGTLTYLAQGAITASSIQTYSGTGGTSVFSSAGNTINITGNLLAGSIGGTSQYGQYSFTTSTVTVGGNVIIYASNTGNKNIVSFSSGTLSVGGNWTNSDTFTAGTSTVTFNAATTGKTITSGGSAFNNLAFNNAAGGWSFSDSASIAGNFTITTSETASNGVNFNNQSIAVNGNVVISAGKLTMGSSAVTVLGSWTNAGTVVANTSTVTFTGTNNATGNPYSVTTGGSAFNHIVFNNSEAGANVDTWTLADSGVLDLECNDLTVSLGYFYYGARSIKVNGNVTLQGATNYMKFWGDASSAVELAGSTKTIDAASSSGNSQYFYNLTISGSYTLTQDTLVVLTSINLGGSLVVSAGSIWFISMVQDGVTITGTLSASTEQSIYWAVNSSITHKAITLPNNIHLYLISSSGADRVLTMTGNLSVWKLSIGRYYNGYTITLDMNTKNLTVTSDLTLGNGSSTTVAGSLSLSSGTHSIGGNLAMASGSAVTHSIDLGSSNLSVGGNINFTGITVTPGTSTVTMSATATGKTITSASQSFNNLVFNGSGGGWTLQDNVTATTFNMSAGNLIDNGKTVTVNGDLIFANVAGLLTSTGSWIQGASGNISNPANGNYIRNLSIAGTGVTTTFTGHVFSGSPSSANTGLTIGSGTLYGAGKNLYFYNGATSDNLTINNPTIGSALGPFIIYNYASQTFDAMTFPNNFASYIALNNQNTTVGNITASGDWNFGNMNVYFSANVSGATQPTVYTDMATSSLITTGNVYLGSNLNNYLKLGTSTGHSVGGDFAISGTGTGKLLDMGSSTISVGGNINFTGVAVTPGTSTVNMTAGTTGKTITSGGQAFKNLVFNNSAGGWQFNDTTSITGDLTITTSETAGNGVNLNNQAVNIDGNFTLTAGKLTMGSSAVTAGGSWTINGGTQTANTSGVTFDATAGSKTITSGGQSFNNVTFNGSGGGWALQDNYFDINGSLTLSAGVLTANGKGINITGNWTNNVGTGAFVADTGTVTFDGAVSSTSVISGNTNFYNFTSVTNDKILSFASASTQGVSGAFTVNGTTGHNVILSRNGGSGSDQWVVSLSGTRVVSYVTVSNSNNTAGASVNPTYSIDSGNNTNWFASITITASLTGSNGTIDPTGAVSVSYGNNKSFVITANSGYYITTILIDGSAITDTLTSPFTYTFTNVTTSHTINTSFTANGIKIWDGGGESADYDWSVPEQWTGNTVPISTDAVYFNATSTKDSYIDSSFAGTVLSVNINTGYSGTITAYRSLALTDYTQDTGTFNSNGQALTVSGNWAINGGTYTPGATTMTFTATATGKTIKSSSQSLGNVVFDSTSGGWLLSDVATMTSLTVTNTSASGFSLNGQSTTVTGAVTISNTCKFLDDGSTLYVGGVWTAGASTTVTLTGTTTFNSGTSGAKNITTGGKSFNNLTFNGTGSTWTLQDNTTATSITVTLGTLVDNAKTVTVNGNILIADVSGVLTSTGTWIQGASGNISNPNNGSSFKILTIAGTGVTTTLTGNVQVGRTMTGGGVTTMGPGTLTGAYTLFVYPRTNDAITVNNLNASSQISTLGIIPAVSGLTQKAITLPNNFTTSKIYIDYVWVTDWTASGAWNFGNNALYITNEGTGTPTTYVDMGSSALTAGNLYVGNGGANGYLKMGSSSSHSVANISKGGSAVLNKLDLGSGAISVSDSINFTGVAVTPGTSTVNMTAGDTGNTITSNGQTFKNLVFNNANGAWSFSDSASITGNLTITTSKTSSNGVNFNNQAINIDGNFQMDAGLLTMGSSAVTAGGSWTINGGTQTANTSGVTFDATATGKTIKSSSQSFNNLTFNGSGGGWTLQDDLTVTTITVTTGNLVDNAKTVTANGNITIANTPSILTSTGTWVVNATANVSNPYFHNNKFEVLTVKSGITATRTGIVNTKKLTLETNAILTGASTLYISYPTADDALDLASGSNITSGGVNYYQTASTTRNQKAMTFSATFTSGYAASSFLVMTGNWSVGSVHIFSSAGSNTEALSRALDTGGYNLTVNGNLTLGSSSVSYPNQYQGKILFRTGTHTITGDAGCNGQYTYCYMDFGSSNTSFGGNLNFSYTTVTPGTSTAIMNAGATGKTITSASQSFNNLTFNNAAGGWTMSDAGQVNGDFTITTGAVTLPSTTLTVGGNFNNAGGTFTHNSGTVKLTSVSDSATLKTNGSNFNILEQNNGLTGYWKLDEGTGTSTADISGNGYTGTLSGSTLPAWTTTTPGSTYYGNDPQALTFNGTTSYVALPLIHPDSVTYSAWIKTSTASGAIIGTNYGNASTFWHGGIKLSGGKVIMDIGYISSGYRSVTGTITVNDNNWHLITMTSDSTGSFLYVDGTQDGTSAYYVGQVSGSVEQNTSIGTMPIWDIGNGVWTYTNIFNGQIDDARIYNRSIGSTEITALRNGSNPSAGTYTLQDNLSVVSNLNIRTGTLDVSASNYSVSVTGDFNNVANFNARAGTVTMKSITTGNIRTSGSDFNNLEVNNGAVGYWKMDEGTGIYANDLSGNGNTGTLTGPTHLPAWTSTVKDASYYGGDPNAVDFDGTEDYVQITNSDSMKNTSLFSVSFWANSDIGYGTSRFAFTVSTGTSSATLFGVYPYDNSGGNGVRVWWGGNIIDENGATRTGWNHYTFISRSATDHEMYVNGSSIGTSATSKTIGSWENLRIGAWYPTSQHFDGSIDDVRVYNKALSTDEITELYAGTNPTEGTYTLQDNLDVNGNLGVRTGKLDASASNYNINVAGNLANASNIDNRANTFTLDGGDSTTQTISGSTTFYNLTANTAGNGAGRTITFTNNSTQTVSNTLSIAGASGKVLTLNSTIPGSAWYFVIPADMNSGDWINVRDSQNITNSYTITPGANVTNSGNNTPGWNFGLTLTIDDPTLTFGGLIPGDVYTGYTETSVTINYLSGYSLSISDSVAGSNSALLHTDTSTRVIDYAGTIATPTSWSSGYGLGICPYLFSNKPVGGKWGDGTLPDSGTNKYAGVPQVSDILFTNNDTTINNDLARIGYKLVVPSDQKTGDYSGDILYTATPLLP